MIFRFDDMCGNTDVAHANALAAIFTEKYDAEIWYCVSPLFFDTNEEKCSVARQRVFPRILNAHSDYTEYYKADKCRLFGRRSFPNGVVVVSHGLTHVDHRLMCYGAQEISIVASCALTESNTFVPPFNKWNGDTEKVCDRHGITLVKFEHCWKCIEYEPYDERQKKWYLHSRELTINQAKEWTGGLK